MGLSKKAPMGNPRTKFGPLACKSRYGPLPVLWAYRQMPPWATHKPNLGPPDQACKSREIWATSGFYGSIENGSRDMANSKTAPLWAYKKAPMAPQPNLDL